MKVLVVGSGGREHAIVWALARSPQVTKIYNNSANAGILELATRVNADDIVALADFAQQENIDLTVVGPEQYLVDGIVDEFTARGLKIFGPSKAAARLEGSKIFAKEFMLRHQIPTARSAAFSEAEAALAFIQGGAFSYPLVIKADGLAAGKGVVIAQDEKEATATILAFMQESKLGQAGTQVLFEECLIGRELSFLIFSDGSHYLPLPFAQDHKRAFDGDHGPNTGGMGVFSTPGMLDAETEKQIIEMIVAPSLKGAVADGYPFRGILFIGLMLTAAGPKVLEYNVRFGDPETQTVLRKLDSDIVEIFLAAIAGTLNEVQPRWSDDSVTCVVMASGGYPGSYATGKVISGLTSIQSDQVVVFHAGTKSNENGEVVSAGGRVLAVTARAASLALSTEKAYDAIAQLSFEDSFYRKDIARC